MALPRKMMYVNYSLYVSHTTIAIIRSKQRIPRATAMRYKEIVRDITLKTSKLVTESSPGPSHGPPLVITWSFI